MGRNRLLGATVLLGAFWMFPRVVVAEVQTVKLPADYSDFAFNPETGTLAAISPETHKVAIYRAEDLHASPPKPVVELPVGRSPCGITYKQFGTTRVFAIVCAEDGFMHLIDAGGGNDAAAEFKPLKKVKLSGENMQFVAGSLNAKDPYLYYACEGPTKGTGAIDLRDMQNDGILIQDACCHAVSAGGTLLYCSDFGRDVQVFSRVSSPTASKLRFEAQGWYDQKEGFTVVDPLGVYAVSGPRVFNRTMDEDEGALSFHAMCFANGKPVLFGEERDDNLVGEDEAIATDTQVTLQAASFNSLTRVGEEVRLSLSLPGQRSIDMRFGDYGPEITIRKVARLFWDGPREQLLRAEGPWVHLIPVSDFRLPEEPFLLANLEGSTDYTCGKEQKIKLSPKDKRVTMQLGELPEGMKQNGNELIWKPGLHQVGPVDLLITLKHGELEREISLDLRVHWARLPLPLPAFGVALNSAGTKAVLWTGENYETGPKTFEPWTAAVIDLKAGAIQAQGKLQRDFSALALGEEHLFVYSPHVDPTKCDVYSVQDLKHKSPITLKDSIRFVRVFGNHLLIVTENMVYLYDATTLKQVKKIEATFGDTLFISSEGLLLNGVLYGFDLTPKLMGGLDFMLALPSPMPAPGVTIFDRAGEQILEDPYWTDDSNSHSPITANIPGSSGQVRVQRNYPEEQSIGVHGLTNLVELTIDLLGDAAQQQVFYREVRSQGAWQPRLAVAGGNAYVFDNWELYTWPLPSGQESAELRWQLAQSEFIIPSTGKTELKHSLEGGHGAVTFSLGTPQDWLSIDESTGTITVDNEAALAEAMRYVREDKSGFLGSEDALAAYMQTHRDRIVLMAGRQPKGVPIAIPIHLVATDANMSTSHLEYYVVAELPQAEMRKAIADRMAAPGMPGAADVPPQASLPSNPPQGELAQLQQQVASLEEKLAKVVQQLNDVMDVLEEQQKKDAE